MMSFGDLSSSMLELSDSLKRAEILLSYCGTLDRNILQAILNIAKNRLAFINEKPELVKRVYDAINETLENTIVHSKFLNDEKSVFIPLKNIFIITNNKNNYNVASGNFIKPEREIALKEILEKVNALSKEELKEAYQLALNRNELTPINAAEISFIDMAIKSDSKLEYSFNHKNGEVFFSLSITINKN
ncbi:MAG: SiaB family protein kinase [Bacteroidia bacterium]